MKRNTPKAIAAQTGGEYELFDTRNGFEDHLLDFTNHLHSRYLLSFQAKDPVPGLHRITVRLAEPSSGAVLARSSYWVGGAPWGQGEEPQIGLLRRRSGKAGSMPEQRNLPSQ